MKDFANHAAAANVAPQDTSGEALRTPRRRGVDFGGVTGLALTVAFVSSSAVRAQGASEVVPEGFVALSDAMGVASARILSNGSLQVVLADGSVRTSAAGDFVMLEDGVGAVAVSESVAEALLAFADGLAGVAGNVTPLVAGVAGGALGAATAEAGDTVATGDTGATGETGATGAALSRFFQPVPVAPPLHRGRLGPWGLRFMSATPVAERGFSQRSSLKSPIEAAYRSLRSPCFWGGR